MKKLVDGIHQFQKDSFNTKQQLFEGLVKGQHPLALFITCSDSRIDPNLITQTEPGELFILRNAGNIVPAYGSIEGGEAATIEYAVNVLGIKDIVVCGHSHCGAMGGLLDLSQLQELPAVRSWLDHAESTLKAVQQKHPQAEGEELLALTVEENVLVQLEQLRTHPSVAAAIDRGDLELHGWVYEFETGSIFEHSAQENRFVPLQEPNITD